MEKIEQGKGAVHSKYRDTRVTNMATAAVPRSISGVVISSGKMMKTVKVRVAGQKWNKHIRKVSFLLFPSPAGVLFDGL